MVPTPTLFEAAASPDSVKVRMYKGLLGDCFLLTISGQGGTSHILIDCGILQGLQGGAAKMKAVADNIVQVTRGHLDLLVVTHEHHDHISGFGYAPDVFFGGRLTVDRLWMAWTEQPTDPQAKALRARFDKAKRAVAAAAQTATTMTANGVPGAAGVTAGLENFIGPINFPGLSAAAGVVSTGRDVLESLKGVARQVDYLEPGQVVFTPGPAPLRTYVLGPPRSEVRLFKAFPSAGDKKETYFGGDGLGAAAQLLGVIEPQLGEGEPDIPFPKRYLCPSDDVAKQAATEAANSALGWLHDRYYINQQWQRIDADWLSAAGALALKLDSNTNNTSLVLAFETPAGRILLFAADAQVGNWLSWYDQTYVEAGVANDDPKAGVTVDDILSRVALYKVGHHCSHNATLDELGLEKMVGKGLVAMIPVVEADAHAQASGWNMPYPALLARLLEVTKGRTLRGDCKAGYDPNNVPLTQDADFLASIHDEPLFLEYQLPTSQVGAFKAVVTDG